MFSGVIFDFDGVLVDTEILFEEVEREGLAAMGLNLSLNAYQEQFLGLNYSEWGPVVGPMLAERGLPPLPEDFKSNMDRVFRQKMAARDIVMAGTYPLLEALHAPKAIGTSAPRRALEYKLGHTELALHFEGRMAASDEHIRPKPAPDVPREAARLLDLDPADCVVIEDSPTGVRAALAAGATVWGFTGGTHSNDQIGARLLDEGAARLVPDMATLGTALAALGLAQ